MTEEEGRVEGSYKDGNETSGPTLAGIAGLWVNNRNRNLIVHEELDPTIPPHI